ncbi:MAG: 50S ribosomal protein L23, partial [Candidatus Bathyarchaeia archaeon]
IVITPDGRKKAFVKLSPEFKATDVAIKLGII